MSEEYEDDFEHSYEEDFESEGELELPSQLQPASPCEDDDTSDDNPNNHSSTLDTRAWPSLAASVLNDSRGNGHATGKGLFNRSFLATPTDNAPATKDQRTSSDVTITFQPPVPRLSDSQRKRAAIALQHAQQMQSHVKLRPSTQLDLLVLHPLPLYQQFQQGIGVFACTASAASQTKQLDLDIREQDSQTDEIDQLAVSCQAPEDLYSIGSHLPPEQQRQQHAAAQLMPAADPSMAEFVNWAVPQVLFELQRAEAECAAEAALASSVAEPAFQPLQTACHVPCSSAVSKTGNQSLLAGEFHLPCTGILAGRSTVGVSGPALHETATAAAAAIASATAAVTVSRHLLLVCCSPVPLPAAEAVLQHNLNGLGCLCVWDLLQASRPTTNLQAGAGSDEYIPSGILQLLVCEGRPTCCCWGAGAAVSLVFAGMEEGGICCWDLSEPDALHQNQSAGLGVQQQQQPHISADRKQPQQHARLPLRRPSCSTEVPLFCEQGGDDIAATSAVDVTSKSLNSQHLRDPLLSHSGCLVPGGVVALSALPSVSGSASEGAGAAAPVCRLVALTAAASVSLYSVMRAEGGSSEAVGSLGTRSGSIVWLMKVCEGLPCGMDIVKPPCMRASSATSSKASGVSYIGTSQRASGVTRESSSSSSSAAPLRQQQHASSLVVMPGPAQQLLVGTANGLVLKGAVSGATSPPHVYLSQQWTPGRSLYSCAADAPLGSPSMPGSSALSSADTSDVWPGVLLGHVTSLSVCPVLSEAWAAGHSCGRVAVFSQKRSRPCWVWQHPLGIPVLAVRWLPQAVTLVALFGNDSGGQGFLLAFTLATVPQTPGTTSAHIQQQHMATDIVLQPAAAASITLSMQPCCMEVLCTSAGRSIMMQSPYGPTKQVNAQTQGLASTGSSRQSRGATACVVVGFADGSTTVYHVDEHWYLGPSCGAEAKSALQALLTG